MFNNNCPFCGTKGKNWETDPDVFRCPQCSSIFSKFGVVAGREEIDMDEESVLSN
ncbi:MAG: hypothetical protein ISS36_01335 [Candidatus Aenigmarchaeota archaeon]|nr:hypothetical protein [Candidatus Aenigmarchaeota archaeon]